MNAVSAQRDAWKKAGRQALVSGTAASVLSTTLLALLGRRQAGSAVAPTNATSHWLWGDQAYDEHSPTWRHTAVGYLTHHASAVFWALMYERWLDRSGRGARPSTIIGNALAATATAAVVDYVITPRRLRPGFEKHLSVGALVGVFAAIGAGLAIGGALNRSHERRMERLRHID